MENRKPPTIIVTPRISEATLGIGVFGLGAVTALTLVCVTVGVTTAFAFVCVVLGATSAIAFCVRCLRS